MIRALAYRNGSRQYSAHIAAKNIIEVSKELANKPEFKEVK
jgi:hypothetical protein